MLLLNFVHLVLQIRAQLIDALGKKTYLHLQKTGNCLCESEVSGYYVNEIMQDWSLHKLICIKGLSSIKLVMIIQQRVVLLTNL